MFGFIGNMFITAMTFVGWGAFNGIPLRYVSMSNEEYKLRPAIMNINSNKFLFHSYSVAVNKCSGNCNDINNPYAKLCVPDVVKDINVKVSNLISRINETRHVTWHETCACKFRLDANVFNNKQRWNNDKFGCKCKGLIGKGTCDDGFI